MNTTWVSTHVFRSFAHAVRYYSAYGYTKDEIRGMREAGAFVVGALKRRRDWHIRTDGDGRWVYGLK